MSSTPDSKADVTARISRLFVYPVKSCAGIELRDAVLTDTGLDLDRAWMVVDDEGEFMSQRELPRMALIQPQLKFNDVVLRAPGMLALHLSIDAVEVAVKVRCWDEEVDAFDMGNIAAQWFSDFLGRKLRLVRFDPDFQRLSSKQWTGGIEARNQFSDGYPVLVISEASLQAFNERMAGAGHAPVGIERFRPNIVLSGIEAHDEDRLDLLSIVADGDAPVRLKAVKPCGRCPIPNIDPKTAQVSPEVGDVLQSYRQNEMLKGAPSFGMNLIVLDGDGQSLKVGHDVTANWRFD
jgi:uncharacterized protein YcbX